MPGMMDTFLNVGINRAVCEKLSARPGYAWAAWDSYRRFLQMWGMSSGLDRNFFDGLIETYKAKFKVTKKLQFKPEQMKEIALCYREELHARGIKIFDNPIDQLRYAILKAFQSWDSECAKIFRRQMNLSNDWGTAVTVQEMVFGNLNENSGSGVTFTRAPGAQSSEIELFGDFFFGVQGDDIVSGLIETFPISEAQRHRENRNCSLSLESQFPQIYEKMVGYAHHLIRDKGFNHQEIEFTFENQQTEGLYILQTRDQYQNREVNNVAFVDTPSLRASLLGNGVGVGGSAISGQVSPEVPLILIRPDTVPEDVGLLLQVEALLTARGGRTSHAAVTIPQLGKVGVVGFNKLKVYENESFCLVGSHKIQPGDYLSLDGVSGAVYHGQHQPESC
jgi:pyruvate,orthophosphate dikinase